MKQIDRLYNENDDRVGEVVDKLNEVIDQVNKLSEHYHFSHELQYATGPPKHKDDDERSETHSVGTS